MSTVNLECEVVEDDELVETKMDETIEELETHTEEYQVHMAEVGRVFLDLEKNTWNLRCFFCEFACDEITLFKEHVNNNHIELLPSENNDVWETGSSTGGATNLEITPMELIKEEEEEHLDEELSLDEEETPGERTESESSDKPNYPHKCEFCSKTFRYLSKLRYHITLHTGELPFKCNQCDKGFRSNDVLRLHVATHTNDKPFKCDHCDLSFNQKRYLQMHIKYHLGGQTFPCTICGKNHRTNSQLKVHMTKHSAKKENVCEICGACYRLRQHLVIHVKQKHENKREFRCDECDKAFNTIGFLNNHKLSHSKERSHICNVCGMGFIWRKNLQEHIKLHAGTKNHKCALCSKAFAQKSGLLTHMKSHSLAQ